MGAIKITPADSWFSKCVRERAGNRCERCGGSPAPGGLHCSHFHGRGKWSVRFEPMNGTSLCMGCHLYLTANPNEHADFQQEIWGGINMQALRELANDTTRGRVAKREAKAIAAHYREQHREMVTKRDSGETGRIEFVGYL